MPYLSREDIEKIADRVVCQYKKAYVPERHMCYMVDAAELAEMLGFKIEYVHITRDGSILGQTSSGRVWTTIYDDNMNQLFFELDGSTMISRIVFSVTTADRLSRRRWRETGMNGRLMLWQQPCFSP